jgi:hypothetical protein
MSWVSRRLALVELLPEAIQQLVREGQVSAQVAMKYLVPVARISLDDCERMAAAFAEHHCDTREAGQLYAAWRDALRPVRERLLASPELFFKTQRRAPSVETTQSVAAGGEPQTDRELEFIRGGQDRTLLRTAAQGSGERLPLQFIKAQDLFDEMYASLADPVHATAAEAPVAPGRPGDRRIWVFESQAGAVQHLFQTDGGALPPPCRGRFRRPRLRTAPLEATHHRQVPTRWSDAQIKRGGSFLESAGG